MVKVLVWRVGDMESRLGRLELMRMLKRADTAEIEVCIGGERYPAVTSAIYKAEDGKTRVCILAYGDREG